MNTDPDSRYQTKGAGFTSGFFWGLILGTIATFFFATPRGRKLRQYLGDHGQQFLEELEEFYTEVEGNEQPAHQKKEKRELAAKSEAKTGPGTELAYIKKLQERGRKVVNRFFTRGGKVLH